MDCAAATLTRRLPLRRTFSSTSSAPRKCCTCRSSRTQRLATTRTLALRYTPPRRARRSCAPRALALALSMIARRPVKVALTFEEMFYQITKHPCTFRIKSGVDNDGKVIARKCEVFWNGGAYADIGPRVTQKAGVTASGPYNIDNVSIDSLALYTNVTPSGALRGFGVPQLVWAYESHTT